MYGIAPAGTRDFPINPGLVSLSIDPNLGIFTGTRPGLAGYATDHEQPTTYDANVAVQRQVLKDLAVTVAYHYRRTSNDLYAFDANRFIGDLVDGSLDRLNPNYGVISTNVNLGRRRYHGLFVEASKRLSQGWQVNGSYAYNNGRSNIGPTRFLIGGGTEAFNPDLDWARDEPSTHTAKMNAIWDLPFLRDRGGLISTLFGNWQLATIWNVASGSYFTPVSYSGLRGGRRLQRRRVALGPPRSPHGRVNNVQRRPMDRWRAERIDVPGADDTPQRDAAPRPLQATGVCAGRPRTRQAVPGRTHDSAVSDPGAESLEFREHRHGAIVADVCIVRPCDRVLSDAHCAVVGEDDFLKTEMQIPPERLVMETCELSRLHRDRA